MSAADTGALMLLTAHMLALGVAGGIFIWMFALHRRARRLNQSLDQIQKKFPFPPESAQRPAAWLAVRSVESETVRSTLTGKGKFFVSPRVNGWVIVTGPDLPNPDDDVDACFLFLTALSRALGHVQFFYAEKFSQHHAWARLDEGCVTRAYAWTGETIWNQGARTLPEIELGLKCFPYGHGSPMREDPGLNCEKVPALAARWSVDPATRRAGASSQLY